MTTKTKSASLDPRPPVVTPDNPDVHPPVKRKTRSDKGKKRETTNNNGGERKSEKTLDKEAAAIRAKYKPFDEKRISDNWKMQVWPCWNNFSKYEIRFVFDGVRYGYKQTFDDASLAVALGTQYLDHRYKNKASYVS